MVESYIYSSSIFTNQWHWINRVKENKFGKIVFLSISRTKEDAHDRVKSVTAQKAES